MITVYVLGWGELFQIVLNAIAAFMKQDSFLGLLRITSLAGIIMATAGYLKSQDPMVFGKWFFAYLLFTHIVLIPKTSVLIDDISSQVPKVVDNVPVVFALPVSLITSVGYGLAQSYDALLSLPDDLLYTQTGSLFASRLIQASRDFHIINPELKGEMDHYFRTCVVGDIRINHKYSVGDLVQSNQLWQLISEKASPFRMLSVNQKLVTCAEGAHLLRQKLDKEIQSAYRFFGINLFGKPKSTSYEKLFETHLTSAFNYYQGLTDSSSNIMLQSMMINAVKEGMTHYQTLTDSTASVVNQQFAKSQVQHRWSWQIAGLKALWFLPILHTMLTVLLFGVFPVIIALATVPGGTGILFGYFQFFVSLQFWPVLFAILNAVMTMYGHSESLSFGQINMLNIDKVDELHQDIAGVAGYLMLLIPFLANGLVSNLGSAFNGLATSMTGHLQGSAMALAGEAASGSFSLGQTSFYNTSANNLSANKHDSNWSHLHGLKTEQLGSGVLKTLTGQGDAIFDVSPGLTKSHVHVADSKSLTHSLNEAYEHSTQEASNQSQQYQSALSHFAHRAIQLSNMQGHELRMGDGVSESKSSQYNQAISTITQIAKDVAARTGVSQEEALTHLTSGGMSTNTALRSDRSLVGRLAQLGTGFSASMDGHLKSERSSHAATRFHEGTDSALSSREAHDFHQAFNVIKNYSKTHSLDEGHSAATSLSNQMGADLREAFNANQNYEASLSKATRINSARQFVESHSTQVSADLNQAFPAYVASKVGIAARDKLFARPGDMSAVAQLEALGNEFVAKRAEAFINKPDLAALYHEKAEGIAEKSSQMGTEFLAQSQALSRPIGPNKIEPFKHRVEQHLNDSNIESQAAFIKNAHHNRERLADITIQNKKDQATDGVLPGHAVDKALNWLHIKKEEK